MCTKQTTESVNMKICIVTPSYNQQEFLDDCIKSVINEHCDKIDYFIMDGGSTDGTIDIITKYDAGIDFWRSREDRGQAAAINEGWQMSSSEVVGWLNSDDKLAPNALNTVAKAFENASAKIVVGNCKVIDRNGNTIGVSRPDSVSVRDLLYGTTLPQPSVFVHRDVASSVGFLDESLVYELDWDFFLRCMQKVELDDIVYVDKVLSMSRKYGDTKTMTGLDQKGKERRRCLREKQKNNLEISVFQKCIAETYIHQGTYNLLNGNIFRFVEDALKSIYYSPSRSFKKVNTKKLSTLMQKILNPK